MALTSKQYKMIAWFSEERGLVPQLSTPPIMYFTNKKNEPENHHLTKDIEPLYDAHRKEYLKEKARAKKAADKQTPTKFW